MMTHAIQQLIRSADAAFATLYLGLREERCALMSFLFHSLFRNQQEMERNLVDPLQRTTLAQFRQFIEYYLEHGYHFVSPDDLLKGLQPDRKYALITFDDGYFNNFQAVPILEEFNVPAVFFISTNHVLGSKCYWWDVIYRERLLQGATPRQVYHEAVALKDLRTEDIETELRKRFGNDAFTPRSDIDRPFSPDELKQFAASPMVHIGNHTANHAILTNYTDEEVRQQITNSQMALARLTGKLPISIAYPNGAHSPSIVQICSDLGLKVGFTIRPEKAPLPLDPQPSRMMRLGRFCPHGEAPILRQCRTYRSDVLLYGLFRDSYLRLVRGKVAQ